MRRGTNLLAVGGFNQAVILDLIRRAPQGLSRVEIAGATGLSAQTVSNVSRRLIDSGIVLEAGKLNVGPGKPRTLLQLEPTGLYSIGVHLDPTVITYVLLDLAGDVVTDHRAPLPANATPDSIIREMAERIAAILEDSVVPHDRVLGVGIAAPGPVDAALGILLDPPLLDGWTRVPLREALADATGFPVVLEKDVAAAAVAEIWTGGGGERDNFAFFYYGTGIGMGLVIDRDVLRGSSNNAGDMGHIRVAPTGPLCSCGRRGCIGELVVPHRLVAEAVETGIIAEGPPASSVDDDFSRFSDVAADGSAGAIAILDRTAAHIAAAVVVITNLLDVDRVIFGGPFWQRVSARVLPTIAELVNADPALISPHPIEVSDSAIGEDVAAIGAGCLVLDHFLSPRPSALLISE
ncbi:putative NBD/HSP70 family sugar kinase [Conyzicola lurida]|uniref:Putative NBD/HSP70 family sugar kinase n=1 Tax=Conyzicola lurida TaxID=1172621 RepID=A0A841AJM7_9MICO|nr:putative NBD/HSP70 family sugar kinase [Conyzicola lurida]